MIEFEANGGRVPGYLAMPQIDALVPGVVVVQEWWGLNNQIKGVADRLAAEGFAALVPDLYHGHVAEEPDDARKLAMEMSREQALVEIQGAVDYLVGLPGVDPKTVGVMGFCMGGALAAMMSYAGENVGAAVIYYGRPPLDRAGEVKVPFLGLYGENDHSITVKDVMEFDTILAQNNINHEIHIYDEAPHAFANEEGPNYRPEAAEDAWQRTVEWFRRYLKDEVPGESII